MRKFTRNVYILGIIFAIVAGLNAYVVLPYVNAPVRRELERKMEAELNFLIGEVSSTLTLVEKTLNTAGYYIAVESDEEKIARFLAELLTQNPSYLAIYLGTPDGDIAAPWYAAAVRDGGVAYTTCHEDSRVITASMPFFGSEQELLAVVAIDISIGELQIFFEADRISQDRHFFFMADDNTLFGAYSHADLDPSLFAEPLGMTEFQLDGIQGYLRWETVGESELIVATFAPDSAVFARHTQNKRIIGFALLSLVLGSLGVFVFLRIHVVVPMRELGHDLMAISLDRDVTYRLPVRKSNSLGIFRQALNVTLHKAQEHHEHVVRQRKELADAYQQLTEHEQELQKQYLQIKENEEKIRFMADYDPLTGLPNRRRFQEDLQATLDEGGSGAVFLLDIDDFKNINDTQGHSCGDRILSSVAQSVQDGIPPGATAYRFGGDEFVIIVRHQFAPERVQVYVNEISRKLQVANQKEGKKNSVTCSMGVVLYPLDGNAVDELLIKADVALHHAKNAGKNRHCFFEDSMATMFSERVQMEQILANAVRTDGFHLVYQPIIRTRTGEVACFEALVRLRDHPASPTVFIPIAEESDLIIPLGYWVIKEVARQLAAWQQSGKKPKPVAINLSTKQFQDPHLLDYLRQQLHETGVDPALLQIEFTEGVLFGDAEMALHIMEQIRALGIRQSLDNYGTGYSFINYMTRMPVDYLKVHGALTENVEGNPDVMEGLISIAHGLEMEVVAEQVETLEEARALSEANCDYLQGFLFSRPVGSEKAELMFDHDYSQVLGLEKEGES